MSDTTTEYPATKLDVCNCCGGISKPGSKKKYKALFYGEVCSDCETGTKRNKVPDYPIDPSLRKYELDLAAGKVACPFTAYSVKFADGFEICSPVKLSAAGKPPKGLAA